MSYTFMRMILFFDLPMTNKKQKRIYSKFRKELIKRGFFMIQYSVYTKIFANRDAAEGEKAFLKRVVPEKGNIRIMIVTEKQFARMECIVGGISDQEETITKESFILL